MQHEKCQLRYTNVHLVMHLSWIQMMMWTSVILTAEAVRIMMKAV
jgi:hypothetical protein